LPRFSLLTVASWAFLVVAACFFSGCEEKTIQEEHLFQLVEADSAGLHFSN